MQVFLANDYCTCELCLAVVEMERRLRLALEVEAVIRAKIDALEHSYRTLTERMLLCNEKVMAWEKIRIAKLNLAKARAAAVHNKGKKR